MVIIKRYARIEVGDFGRWLLNLFKRITGLKRHRVEFPITGPLKYVIFHAVPERGK